MDRSKRKGLSASVRVDPATLYVLVWFAALIASVVR